MARKKAELPEFKYPLVVVEWEDAHSDSEWTLVQEIKTHGEMVTSAGFLIHQDDGASIITVGYSEDSVMDRVRIPAGMIRKITVIKEV